MDVSRALASEAPAPENADDMLALLVQRPEVRGAVTLTADARVIWAGGAAFDTDASPLLGQVVALVHAVLAASRTHVHEMDPDDALGLLRVRTRKHEIIITQSEHFTLAVLQDHATE